MPNNTRNIELYKDSIPFNEIYPDFDLTKLPDWVSENISDVRVYGNQKKGIILPDGRKYHLNNKLNEMTGRDWTFFINSVFSTHYPTRGKESYAHHIRKIHPTPKPPQLMRDIITFFTKKNELVFDAFMGVGGTLLGAALVSRKAAGIDLSELYINAYLQAAVELELKIFPTLVGDSTTLINDKEKIKQLIGEQEISLLLIDPPYANMMSKEKTGGDMVRIGADATPFTSEINDLGNMDINTFLITLKQLVSNTLQYIKKEGYIIVFIKDLQPKKKELNLLHADVISKLNEIPKLHYKGMKIWCDDSAKIYPYGYPFSFVANQIHQYILVFRKEK